MKIFCTTTVIYLLGIFLMQCQPTSNKVESTASETEAQLVPVPFNKVQLKDNFWRPCLHTQAETLLPFALDKTVPAVENLAKAARFLKGEPTDLPFPHRFISSDLYNEDGYAKEECIVFTKGLDLIEFILENRSGKTHDSSFSIENMDPGKYQLFVDGQLQDTLILEGSKKVEFTVPLF